MSNRSVSGAHRSSISGHGVSASKDSPLQQLSQSLRRAGHQRKPSTTWGDLSKIRPESPPRFHLQITVTEDALPLGQVTLNRQSVPLQPGNTEKRTARIERLEDSRSIKYPIPNTISEGRQDTESGIWIDGQVSDLIREC